MTRHFTLATSLLFIGAVLLAGTLACSSNSSNGGGGADAGAGDVAVDTSGPAACVAAGGQCVLGGASCSSRGPQDCNPDRNPGGAFCCLSGLCPAAPVQATNYDQTCTVDSDCVSVAEGNPCMPCGFGCPSGATINVGALTKYRSDIANTPAVLSAADGGCLSTCGTASGRSDYGPFCCAGMCHVGGPCLPADAGAEASIDAGPDAAADACAPSGCTASCVAGAHNISTMVGGCIVWQCCVLDDAGGNTPDADAGAE